MTHPVTADVDVLAPASTSVGFAGRQVEILPIPVGRIPVLIRTARPVIDALIANNVLTGEGDELDIDVIQIVDLIGDHGEQFFEALSIAAGVSVADVEAANLDDVVRLTQTCVRVNRDFFTKNVVPLLAGMARQLPGVGPTPSSS
ncbi:hypothetical protein ARC78_07615 [Stenotrophomonas pictorum JCM 9942]|uniref:Uncharacterized protein n=1 Tax=Stenotrophomonas pictorum JCM 9942 TaxID=1236960 RepID=A0A0R0ARQ4_9GAMM|nr:hypothetical protein [Stenotrophomonas pictorum]KRG43224.1 hypothetical protein ARC78_07615 [Stenotrophomonas pictorum JCM 9942]